MSAKKGSARRNGKRGGEGEEPGLKKRKHAVHAEEFVEEEPEETAPEGEPESLSLPMAAADGVETASEPIAVLAEANGAGALAARVASNGHQPEKVFCYLKVELGPDAVRCFTDGGVQIKMVKGVIFLAEDRGCRVRVLEARFAPERSASSGSDAKKFSGGFKRPN